MLTVRGYEYVKPLFVRGGRITAHNLIHKQMSNFKDRLIDEQAQLEEKLNKLDAFLMSDKVKAVDDVQKALLQVQAR